MTIIAKNPKDYGLENIQIDEPVQYDTIQLTAPTSLNLIADAIMQPVSVVRDLNPALLKVVAPVGFEVHVPKGSGEVVQSALESVPAVNRQAWRLHHVLAGDTLATIARAYHLTPDRIASVNPAADSISQGDVLLIPAAYHEQPPVRFSTRSRRTSVSSSRTHKNKSVPASTHVAASRHLPVPVVHRKAAIHTASLQ
jgi:membrane-bound lytic murein transglycosylase D